MYIFLFYHAHFYIGTPVGDGDDDMSSKYILTTESDGEWTYGSHEKVLLKRCSDGEPYTVEVTNFCLNGSRLSSLPFLRTHPDILPVGK